MATANNLITQANFNGSWKINGWRDSHSSKDYEKRLFICAPVWYMKLTSTYYAFGGSGIFQVYISYYNGSTWSSEWHYECNGSGSTGGKTIMIGHNRNEGNLNVSLHNDYPLWRIRYWPSRSNSRWNITVWTGGWGVAKTGATFWKYPLGKKIYSIGRSGDPIHVTGANDNHPFNYLSRRGNPILAAYDYELVSYPYLD